MRQTLEDRRTGKPRFYFYLLFLDRNTREGWISVEVE